LPMVATNEVSVDGEVKAKKTREVSVVCGEAFLVFSNSEF
jgi:hypothetical protein